MKEIELTQGYTALVDDADYEWMNSFEWRALKSGSIVYASRTIQQHNRKFNVMMHRHILGIITPSTKMVDHIDGNGLNNQKANLRIATRNQNMRNLTKTRKNNSSGYRGVSFDKESQKWLACIYVNGKQKKLGRFSDITDAARAFDSAAKEFFGEFCGKLNLDQTRGQKA